MRRILVTLTLMGTTALAGGAGPRPANAPAPVAPVTTKVAAHALPANALVQPGQTWVMIGTTADGQPVNEKLTLSKAAPEWYDGWDFEIELGGMHLSAEQDRIFAATINPEDEEMKMCMAIVEGKNVTGVLISGDMESLYEKMSDTPAEDFEVDTVAQLQKVFKDAGVPFGSCNLTSK